MKKSLNAKLKAGRAVRAATRGRSLVALGVAIACAVSPLTGCRQISEKMGMNVAPRELRDVPAVRLAFHLQSDIETDTLPENVKNETPEEPLATVRTQFESSRKDEALLRTVVSPDGQRVLALYAPNDPGFPPDEFLIFPSSMPGAST